jgi:hypothetical protein
VWDAANGHLLATLQGHADAVRAGSFSPGLSGILCVGP